MSALSPYLQVLFSGFERGPLADPEATGESWVCPGPSPGGVEKQARGRGSGVRRLARSELLSDPQTLAGRRALRAALAAPRSRPLKAGRPLPCPEAVAALCLAGPALPGFWENGGVPLFAHGQRRLP